MDGGEANLRLRGGLNVPGSTIPPPFMFHFRSLRDSLSHRPSNSRRSVARPRLGRRTETQSFVLTAEALEVRREL